MTSLGEFVGDLLQIAFAETHATDFYGGAGFDQENRGDAGYAVGVGGGVAGGVEERGECDSEFFVESFGVVGVVLRDGEEGDALAAVAFVQALEIRECELADWAGDFEKGDDYRPFFKFRVKRVRGAV